MREELKKDIIQWDIENWGAVLDFWAPHLSDSANSSVLTLGERDGGLTLWFANQQFEVTASDLEGLTDAGKALHQQYQVQNKVKYAEANMLQLPFDSESYDLICFKSVLGALSAKEKQQQAIDEIYRVLKPGGKLLFAENLEGNGLHKSLRKRFVKWSTYWRYLKWPEDKDLFKAFDKAHFSTRGTLGLLGRSEGQRKILGKIDALIKPVTRPNARYILFGVLEKQSA